MSFENPYSPRGRIGNYAGAPSLGTNSVPGVSASAWPFIRTWGMLFYTWNQGSPTDYTQISATRFQKGYNYDRLDYALKARIRARGGDPDSEVVYWTAQTGGGISPSGQYVQLSGESVFDLAAMFDIVVLGHSPPPSHMAEITSRSHIGTKIITGLHNFESINQSTEWNNAILGAERAVSRAYPLTALATSGCASNGLNSFACTTIDKYETIDSCSGWSGADATNLCDANACGAGKPVSFSVGKVACPHDAGRHAGLPANADVGGKHTWEVDVTNSTYRSLLVSAFGSTLTTSYTGADLKFVIDGYLLDNHGTAYKGTASTDFPAGYTGTYVASWKSFDSAFQTAINGWNQVRSTDFFYWGNCSDSLTNYDTSSLRNRWSENFFVENGLTARTLAEISAGLYNVKISGMRLVLGMTGTFVNQHYWATTSGGPVPATNGTWADVMKIISDMGIQGNCYVQTLRMTSGGYGFWQEGVRPYD